MHPELAREMPERPIERLPEWLLHMMRSRAIDRREGILFRQGRGWFQLPSAGHEAMAAAADCLGPEDYVFPYYRDRALMLARGATSYEMALDFFGKAESSSAGRQLAGFHSNAGLHMVSLAAPTGLQCLPAAGCAWGCQMRKQGQIVLCTIGDAALRQGEYYEALCFAVERNLPIVFAIEDNGYGVSTPTAGMNPYRLGVLDMQLAARVDGRRIEEVHAAFQQAAERARSGGGPSVLWIEMDRLFSHSASDDHALYRPRKELLLMAGRDPIELALDLAAEGTLLATGEELDAETRDEYDRAERAPDPDGRNRGLHLYSDKPPAMATPGLPEREEWTMAAAITETLRDLLAADPRVLLFGEDIEDGKGGVFGLTKGLSSAFPGRVVNSPLAEATIAGTACGLALAGMLPIIELQFIDFAGPAFNQLVNQIATLRWRSMGAFQCPMVIVAPCGAYLPAGGPWHSQTGESWYAHAPGLQIVMPSTPQDAAALLRCACAGEDPVLYLAPKHLFRKRVRSTDELPVHIGEACVRREGTEVTVAAWGNSVEIAMTAAADLGSRGVSVEVVDLRSIVPCDGEAIRRSLAKTGRLVVVQEDSRTCSFGQAIVAEMTSREDCWRLLAGPPQLVSREDVHIGFHPKLEAATMPDADAVRRAVELVIRY